MKQTNGVDRKRVIHSVTLMVFVVPVLLMVPSCASLSKADCLYGDWYEIGLRDGLSGVESERFSAYVDTCARYGVRPDSSEYSKGRTKGLESFCTSSVGYSEGRMGRDYRYVCSGIAEELFLVGHSLGFNVHSTEDYIHTIVQAIAQQNTQIGRWEKQIKSIEEQLVDDDTDTKRRMELIKELDWRHRDITQAKTEIIRLQERRIDAIIDYHEAVDEANDNGFREMKRY